MTQLPFLQGNVKSQTCHLSGPELHAGRSSSYLLLLRGLQDLLGSAHQQVFIFDLLLQNGGSHLQLVHQTLLLVELRVQSAILPPQTEDLMLQTLALLQNPSADDTKNKKRLEKNIQRV